MWKRSCVYREHVVSCRLTTHESTCRSRHHLEWSKRSRNSSLSLLRLYANTCRFYDCCWIIICIVRAWCVCVCVCACLAHTHTRAHTRTHTLAYSLWIDKYDRLEKNSTRGGWAGRHVRWEVWAGETGVSNQIPGRLVCTAEVLRCK